MNFNCFDLLISCVSNLFFV